MKKYNTYNIILEIISIGLSIVFAKFLKNIDLIFLYKYILLLVVLIIIILLKIKLNEKNFKMLFFSNLFIVATYYILNLFMFYNL
jgi:hypothetical protein